ncbi:MAG: nucleotidyltransferase [Clostridiales bacterium]|nr:nucleotidyltransferase [Clostridiales bacterium]
MKTALVVMAAGMGSRFKGGIKQLEGVGPNGEIITDYSVYDALEAGFDEVVFIIRHDIEEAFHAAVGQRLVKAGVSVRYAYQELSDLPDGVDAAKLLAGRVKPWGTGHAVLSCKGILDRPFTVINADDYYGKEAFRRMHQYLTDGIAKRAYCMASFQLKNTLSDHGSVTRGICKTDATGHLVEVVETKNILKAPNGVDAMVDGALVPGDTLVSMNMWGLDLEFLDVLERGFLTFLQGQQEGGTEEYLLPTIIGGLVASQSATVKVLPTGDKWFGVTYREDKQGVVDSIQALINQGVYPAKLF